MCRFCCWATSACQKGLFFLVLRLCGVSSYDLLDEKVLLYICTNRYIKIHALGDLYLFPCNLHYRWNYFFSYTSIRKVVSESIRIYPYYVIITVSPYIHILRPRKTILLKVPLTVLVRLLH